MSLSKPVVTALSDLIENRLSIMTVNDQDDLRERMILQRALVELRSTDMTMPEAVLNDFADIPRRGRRRKVGGMADA